MSRTEIVLITRIRTNNKGNQALSQAWLAMLARAFPEAPVRALERRPLHLLQYSLDQFAKAPDPYRAFDAVARRLARTSRGPQTIGPPTKIPRIELDERIAPSSNFASIRARMNLRGWAARAGRYRLEYLDRLAAFQRARLVLVNPAGEFFPDDPNPAFYHLLDAWVSHRTGTGTGIVNHTMHVNDPTLRRLIPRLYRELAIVGFRDEKSVDEFRRMGGDLSNVVVTADLALTTAVDAPVSRRRGTIAVAIHVPDAINKGTARRWPELILELKAANFDIVLVSNEQSTDHAFLQELRSKTGVPVEGHGLDFERYAEHLGAFDFVISSRMHTSILAMCAGTPVIPIEGPSLKISGLFQELGVNTSVIQSTDPDWISRTRERAKELRDHREEASKDVIARVAAVRVRIDQALLPKLRAATDEALTHKAI